MSTKQTESVRVRIVYNFISNSDSIGELHVFFHQTTMPIEGEELYLENEVSKGIFLPKGKYRNKTEGELKMLRDNLSVQHWVVMKINQDNLNIRKINLETNHHQII